MFYMLNRIPHILRVLEIEIALRCTRGIIINKRTYMYLFSENNFYYFICIHVEIFSLIHNFRMDEKNKWSIDAIIHERSGAKLSTDNSCSMHTYRLRIGVRR